MQQLILQARAEDFKINPTYQQAIPRPTKNELRALDESIRINGQMYPIAVNKDMVVLDGHSRYEVLMTRGMTIKYQIFEFPTMEEEFRFVVESNIMKRHLNPFQRIETMYQFIKAESEKKLINNYDNRIDIINAIKNGHVSAQGIAKEIGMSSQSTNRVLVTMIEEFYLRRTKKTSTENRPYYNYEVLPKAEELLAQSVRKRKVTISRLIGLSTTTIHYGVFLIENSTPEVLDELRLGREKISTAYFKHIELDQDRERRRKYYGVKSFLKCPHCDHVSPRGEFKKVDSNVPQMYR